MTGTVHLRRQREGIREAEINEFATWQHVVHQAEQGFAQLKPQEEANAE